MLNKIQKILMLNTENKEQKKKLYEILKSLPWFKENDETPSIQTIEKLIHKIENKYNIKMSYILFTNIDEAQYYSAMIKNSITGEHVTTVYGHTIYEVFTKVLIFMYYKAKKGEI
jgi:hypothetical protein